MYCESPTGPDAPYCPSHAELHGEVMMTPKDTDTTVNHPVHYESSSADDISCIDAIHAALGDEGVEAHCVGCAMKYVWRYKDKGGTEDVRKAIWYLEYLVEARSNRGAK